MSDYRYQHSVNQSDLLNRVIRAVILIIVSLLASITFVSFAVHHMRLQFEEEFEGIAEEKIEHVSQIVSMTINGDDIANDKVNAASKYPALLSYMLYDAGISDMSTESYSLIGIEGGNKINLLPDNTDNSFVISTMNVSDIDSLFSDGNAYASIKNDKTQSVIIPVKSSDGARVAFFEYRVSYNGLNDLGNRLESRVLTAVVISVIAGAVLFFIMLLIPKLIKASNKGGQSL